MHERRTSYLEAAASAAALIADPAVAVRWDEPSALAGMTVGGVAAHLGSQIHNLPAMLSAGAEPGRETVGVLEHYVRARWINEDFDGDTNAAIRTSAVAAGGEGRDAIVDRVTSALAQLEKVLPGQPDGRVVSPPWLEWSLGLDDFLLTRMMEIAVHSDDLAVSVGVPAPKLPAAVIEPVLDLLARLALRRHGQAALLRALTRAERAPATIAAF
jgi:hypothetical protein